MSVYRGFPGVAQNRTPCPVSTSRSSNRTCGFPASGSPTGFTSQPTDTPDDMPFAGPYQLLPRPPSTTRGVLDPKVTPRLWVTSAARPKSGPFPPPALPGFHGTTSLSATPRRPDRSLAGGRFGSGTHRWGFPCLRRCPVQTCRRPYPGGTPGGITSFPGCLGQRPSPWCGRVGSHIGLFEACSAFTRVTACLLAGPLDGPFHRRLRRFRYLHRRSDCYRLERQLPGGTDPH
jgi:hypothetical protein